MKEMTREDAISLMNVIVHMLEPQYDTDRIEDAVGMAIKALEQEPKTGRWNEVFNDIEGEVRFYCSECNDYQMFTSRYCPNCGCRMVEPQESEGEDDKRTER